jgi:hypothetical protein
MPKKKRWDMLDTDAKIEELHRQVLDLAGAIQILRLDVAHIVARIPKAPPKSNAAPKKA